MSVSIFTRIFFIISSLLVVSSVLGNELLMSVPSSDRGVLIKRASVIKPVQTTMPVDFVVWLKLRNKAQFDQLARDLYDPKSPRYRKFLQPGEFERDYAPSNEVENAILHYFITQGMQAKIVDHSIRVTATAQQVQQTLKTPLNYYQFQHKTGYANATAPLLKPEIAHYVSEITGLSNMTSYQPAFRARPPLSVGQPYNLNFSWRSFIPAAQPTTQSLAGFTGAQLQTTYQLNNITPINGTTINGAGQTLVVIDACGTRTAAQIRADANLYNSANGLPLFSAANFKVINPDGTPFTTCASPDAGWNTEIALDIQSSHTLAPGSNTVLVLAQSDLAPLGTAVFDVVNQLINHHFTIAGFPNAYVVSNSWGVTEMEGSSPSMEAILETAATHGISFNFSSMDCGDNTYNSSWPCTAESGQPTVDYPASSLYTTAVGGSSLFVDNQWNYAFETVWGSYYGGHFYGGSTGGISQFYGPAVWQSSISGFTAGGYAGTVGSYNKRALPDIAMLGDPYTGLTIYDGGQPLVYGGTSLACPLFSGALTLLNQRRALLNGSVSSPIGQAAPYLYTNSNSLLKTQALRLITPPHQIISGALRPPAGAPLSAFKIHLPSYGYELTFGWDSSLTIAPESQFWNDGVGVGSPNLPNFLTTMSGF